MLVNFSLGNFLSFKNVQKLDLVPESLKDLDQNLHTPYFYDSEIRLLKSVAIYGHNSYGKSNFIKGFQFFQKFVFNSFTNGSLGNKIEIQPYLLDTSMHNQPSYFEITFLIKDIKYRYTFTLTASEILEEELYYAEKKVRENYLFKRKAQDIIISKTWNKESENRISQNIPFAKPHILFLSVLLAQENIFRIDSISSWIGSNMVVPDNYINELTKARVIYSNPEYQKLILKFIDIADIGFKTIFDKVEAIVNSKLHVEKGLLNMWFDKEIKNFELYTIHNVYNYEKKLIDKKEFELLKDESAGTIKYFILICLISYAIKNSQLIWIDELDARFDSSLLQMLIEAYHDPKVNPINSQMIFTTHNTILLDKKLRRDQMVVIEKNEYGESNLKRMHTSKRPIRAGKSIEKDYRKGKLGGVSKNIIGRTLFD